MSEKIYSCEIERKFLVDVYKLPDISKYPYMNISQGYMNLESNGKLFRLRQILYMSSENNLVGEEYFMAIKGSGLNIRTERECVLWKPQFYTLWPECEKYIVHKFRYKLPSQDGKHIVEYDIYKNGLSGLYIAEVEFNSKEDCDAYIPEDWFYKEVTFDSRYANVNLAINQQRPEL